MPTLRLTCRALLAAALLSLPANPLHAAARNMGWGDSTPGHMAIDFDCAHPPAEATLVVSFVSPVSDLIGIEAKVDMCTKPFDLPEWWRFDVPGGCREGLVELSTDFTAGPASHELAWPASTNQSLQVIYGYTWSAAMNRFSIVVANADLQPVPLVIGHEYYAFKLRFVTPKGPCEGCAIPACFVINSLVLTYSGGVIETELLDGYAMWQGDNDCPFVVAAAPTTWGRVKAIYRSSADLVE